MFYELQTRYDHHKSFYGKANVIIEGNTKKLISYNTHVASLISGKLEVYGTYSATTLRHIKEFARQCGFGSLTKKEIERGFIK